MILVMQSAVRREKVIIFYKTVVAQDAPWQIQQDTLNGLACSLPTRGTWPVPTMSRQDAKETTETMHWL